jgi:Cu/Ag efflux protein CusF
MSRGLRAFTAAASLGALLLSTPARAEPVKGEVRRVDPETGKITITHAPIKSLQMDAMTMVFAVRDADLLKEIKAGDKVDFEVVSVNGQLTVTKIQKTK